MAPARRSPLAFGLLAFAAGTLSGSRSNKNWMELRQRLSDLGVKFYQSLSVGFSWQILLNQFSNSSLDTHHLQAMLLAAPAFLGPLVQAPLQAPEAAPEIATNLALADLSPLENPNISFVVLLSMFSMSIALVAMPACELYQDVLEDEHDWDEAARRVDDGDAIASGPQRSLCDRCRRPLHRYARLPTYQTFLMCSSAKECSRCEEDILPGDMHFICSSCSEIHICKDCLGKL
eukprot:s3755_g1.t1